MRVRTDPDRRLGHVRCHALAPDRSDVDEYGQSSVRGDGLVPPDRETVARLAVATCPE